MKNLYLKNTLIVDPINDIDFEGHILIEDGYFKEIGEFEPAFNPEETRIVDLKGKVVSPGLIDMHVHLREPGEEHKETIATGTKAAAQGGFTAVACMPNTKPPVDNETVLEFIKEKNKAAGYTKIYPVAALTKGRRGEEISEFGILREAGAAAFSDDGGTVENTELMRRCMEYSTLYDAAVLSHCEDRNLSAGGQIHEGYYSTILGLQGIPAAAEEIIIARDIKLAELTGARLHICHISTQGGVELVRRGKEKGIKVTAEAVPHHFSLSHEITQDFDTSTKVNPPLRSQEHINAVIEGLQDGTIDVIASDHAPHSRIDKEVEYIFAAFGISGVETCLAVSINYLYNQNILALKELINKFTAAPAAVLGFENPGIKKGFPADLTVIDLNKEKIVDLDSWHSMGTNTPFAGKSLKGWPVMTVVDGKITAENF